VADAAGVWASCIANEGRRFAYSSSLRLAGAPRSYRPLWQPRLCVNLLYLFVYCPASPLASRVCIFAHSSLHTGKRAHCSSVRSSSCSSFAGALVVVQPLQMMLVRTCADKTCSTLHYRRVLLVVCRMLRCQVLLDPLSLCLA
jgi:hypothetical protein